MIVCNTTVDESLLFKSGLLKLLNSITTVLNFFIIEQLIESIGARNGTGNEDNRNFCFFLILLSFFVSQLDALADLKMSRTTGLMIRRFTIELQQTIFNHVLDTNHVMDKADIQHIFAEHSRNIAEVLELMHILWSTPLQIIIWFIILWASVGPPAIFGIVIFFIVILANGLCCSSSKIFEDRAVIGRRKNAQKLCEFIDNICTVKLCGWERYFADQIASARNLIVINTKFRLLVNGFGSVLFAATPFLVALTILGASVLFFEQNITIEKVYRVLASALHMRWACDSIPSKLVIWQKYVESEKAVRVFLRDSHRRRNAPEDVKCDLNQQLLIPGKVTCLIGIVGCGKTTLIHSILDKQRSLGQLVSYAPQHCWLENETIEYNILFGKRFEKEYYRQVVLASGLNEDFERLTDKMKVIQNGKNLSGGQRQRISLARALYQDRPTVILDDPLSAVDKELAESILTSLFSIGGILHGRTVLIASGSLKALPPCQSLYWLAEGKLTKMEDKLCSELITDCANVNCTEFEATVDNSVKQSLTSKSEKRTRAYDDPFDSVSAFCTFLRSFGLWNLILAFFASLLYQSLWVVTRASIIAWGASEKDSSLEFCCLTLAVVLLAGMITTVAISWPIIDANTLCQSMLFTAACSHIPTLSFDDHLLSKFRNSCMVDWLRMDSSLPPWFSSTIAVISSLIASCTMMIYKLGAVPSLCILIPLAAIARRSFTKYENIVAKQHVQLVQCRSKVNDYVASTINGTAVISALNGGDRFKENIARLLLHLNRCESDAVLTTTTQNFWNGFALSHAYQLPTSFLLCILGETGLTMGLMTSCLLLRRSHQECITKTKSLITMQLQTCISAAGYEVVH